MKAGDIVRIKKEFYNDFHLKHGLKVDETYIVKCLYKRKDFFLYGILLEERFSIFDPSNFYIVSMFEDILKDMKI